MRKTLKFLIASGACLVMAGTSQMNAQAALNLETDAPVAGASVAINNYYACLLYTSPSPRDRQKSRMPSSA